MRKVNFNALQNLEVADAWIETAVSAEKNVKKQKPFFLRPYVIGAATSVVLAVSLGLFALNLMRYSAPEPRNTSAAATTSATSETSATSANVAASSESSTEAENTTSSAETAIAITKATEAAMQSTTDVPQQAAPSPVTTVAAALTKPQPGTLQPTAPPPEEPSKVQKYPITFSWSGMAVLPDGIGTTNTASSPDEETLLPKSALYTGMIELKIGRKSAFAKSEKLVMELTTYYSPLQRQISVSALMSPTDIQAGATRAEFCPFDREVYLPANIQYSVCVTDEQGNEKRVSLTLKENYATIINL